MQARQLGGTTLSVKCHTTMAERFEFTGPTINAFNGIISGFTFFIGLIDGDQEQNLISYLLLLFSYHHLYSKLSFLSSQ